MEGTQQSIIDPTRDLQTVVLLVGADRSPAAGSDFTIKGPMVITVPREGFLDVHSEFVLNIAARDRSAAIILRRDSRALSAITGMLVMPRGPSEPGSAPNQSLISAGCAGRISRAPPTAEAARPFRHALCRS